jgi:cystathionine beta-lyase
MTGTPFRPRSGYNFDEAADRTGTWSIKCDGAAARGYPSGLIPMWVADMDFRTADEVVDALVKVARHGIFGYSDTGPEYFAPIGSWFERRFGARLEPEWLVKAPGVVYAISTAVRAFTEVNDAVIIQTPVYHPFYSCVKVNRRRLVESPLIHQGGRWTIDFADFERKIESEKAKLFILCSPHNPVGRVWTGDELKTMGEICLRHKCLVASDEIHCDFVWGGSKHRVFSSVDPAFEKNTVLMTAPSKTFNLAGLHVSSVFIPDPALRKRYKEAADRTGLSQLSIMGLAAGYAAYKYGEVWFEELKAYLEKSIFFAKGFFQRRVPKAVLSELEGTYLLFADFSALGVPHEELSKMIVHKAGLWLSDGLSFGSGGRGFQRINIATPLKTVEAALERLASLCDGLENSRGGGPAA